MIFFFSSRRRHTRCYRDWSSDVCSSDLENTEAIAVLEGGNILGIFVPGVADFQQVGFQQRNAVGKKLGERAVEVFAQRRVERILKYVSKFSGDFREARKAITCRSSP